jgi:hypothetical protein
MHDPQQSRNLGRSVLAVLAGIAAGVAITLATDVVLRLVHVFPPLTERMPDSLLMVATVYRTIYSVGASYLTARLAPNRPLRHALVGGAMGFAVSVAGAIATWNAGPQFQSHWYPVALAVLALPCAWAGGMIRVRQMQAA